MKIRIYAAVLCMALLLNISLVSPVQGAVGISPSQGIAGSIVTVSDLLVGSSYTIKWDGSNYKTGAVPSSGEIVFTVPETYGGEHTVGVECPTGSSVFTGSFTVIPSIVIDPNSGNVGTSVTVEGTGFASAEDDIEVTYGGENVKAGITADDDGLWSTTFTVPDSSTGSHTVDASGNTTAAEDVDNKAFTVSPKITLDKVTGGVGTSVSVTGTGFDSAETSIKVMYSSKEVRTGIVANVDGTWNTTFTVPSSTKGAHVVDASGESTTTGDVPNITFTVMPGVSIDPSSGYVDDEIEVTGSGFATNEGGIKVTFDGEVIETGLVADDRGYWATTLTIPVGVNGDHNLDAYGNTTITADVTDAVLEIQAQVLLNPKSGDVDEMISVRGTGFSGKTDLTVTYEEEPIVTGLTTDVSGGFSTSFKAPRGKSGECTVAATDIEDVKASAVFAMEATAPDAPRIAAPKDGGRVGFVGDAKVTFDWTDVSDPSGIYYTLEISSQSNFDVILDSYTDLTESEHTLTAAASLSHGEYYWRVKAVDGAGNSSDWTASALVRVSFMTVQSFIIILAAVVAAIILAAVLPGLVGKRRRR